MIERNALFISPKSYSIDLSVIARNSDAVGTQSIKKDVNQMPKAGHLLLDMLTDVMPIQCSFSSMLLLYPISIEARRPSEDYTDRRRLFTLVSLYAESSG